MRIAWRATYQHYKRHLDPILEGLEQAGVTTEPGEAGTVIVASRIDAERAMWTTNPPKRLIVVEHGAGQMYATREGLQDASGGRQPDENVTLFLAPSQRVADQMAPVFPKADRAVVGSPALERLAHALRRRDTEWWSWANTDIGLRLSDSKLYPVWTVHWTSPLYGRAREAGTSWPWSADVLWRMAEHGMDPVAHGHPRLQRKIHYQAPRRQVRTESDWPTAAMQASVLVADNTSVMWEALTVGIPVVAMTPPLWSDDAPHGFPRFGPERVRLPTITDHRQTVDVVGAAIGTTPADPGVYDVVDGATAAAIRVILSHVA